MNKSTWVFLFLLLGMAISLQAQYDADCDIVINGIDSQLYVQRIELGQEVLFSHTHPKLKPSLKNREMVIGKANISVLGEDTYIRLEVSIAAKNAARTYGFIPQTNLLTLKFIDGDVTNIHCAADAKGIYDPRLKKTVFNVFYLIKDKKLIRKKELDKVGIHWSSGYEEYSIYDIQLLMRQMECLAKT